MSKVNNLPRLGYGCRWGWGIAVVVVAFAVFLIRPMTLDEDAQPYFARPLVPEIAGTTTVGQSFRASYPGLAAVSFLVGTNARVNTSRLTFELRDASTQHVLEKATIDPTHLVDNHYLTVQFDPLIDSVGKAYVIWLAAPTAVPGDGITVWADPQPLLAQGRAYIGATPTNAELTFRLSYRLTGFQFIVTIVDRLAAGKPGIWGWPGTYLGLAVLYLLSIIVVIRWSLLAWPDKRS